NGSVSGNEVSAATVERQSNHCRRMEIGESDEQALHYRIAGGLRRRRPRRDREREGGGAAGASPPPRRNRQAGPVGVQLATADAGNAAASSRGAVAVRYDDATRGRHEIDLSDLRRLGKGSAERSAWPVQDRACRAQGRD